MVFEFPHTEGARKQGTAIPTSVRSITHELMNAIFYPSNKPKKATAIAVTLVGLLYPKQVSCAACQV